MPNRSEEVVNDEGMTRLEDATLERDSLTAQAVRQHRERVTAEENRLQAELDHIANVFKQRLWLA